MNCLMYGMETYTWYIVLVFAWVRGRTYMDALATNTLASDEATIEQLIARSTIG